MSEQDNLAGRVKRYARVGAAVGGFAARLAGERYLGVKSDRKRQAAELAAGGSKRHKALLAPFGLDAADPKFWDRGLTMIEGLIDELA